MFSFLGCFSTGDIRLTCGGFAGLHEIPVYDTFRRGATWRPSQSVRTMPSNYSPPGTGPPSEQRASLRSQSAVPKSREVLRQRFPWSPPPGQEGEDLCVFAPGMVRVVRRHWHPEAALCRCRNSTGGVRGTSEPEATGIRRRKNPPGRDRPGDTKGSAGRRRGASESNWMGTGFHRARIASKEPRLIPTVGGGLAPPASLPLHFHPSNSHGANRPPCCSCHA